MSPDIRRSSKLPKPDSRGRIKAYVGQKFLGKKVPFYVGDKHTSQVESQRRLDTIRELYRQQCEMKEGRPHWRECFRKVAVQIGRGEEITEKSFAGNDEQRAQLVECLKSWGIPVKILDAEKHAQGLNLSNEQLIKTVSEIVKDQIKEQSKRWGPYLENSKGLPEDPRAYLDNSKLHKAIKSYQAHLRQTGKKDEDGNLSGFVRKCIDRLTYLKEAHDDIKLNEMTLPKIESMAAYWRNRPKTNKGTRCSKYHAKDQLKELWRFLRWLDSSPDYRWESPKGLDAINRSPIDLPQDASKEVFQTTAKKTYTPEQLGLILRHTDDQGKAIIATCVNCAFGASEIGQWPVEKFVINKPHPHAEKIGIETTEADSWIVGGRPKTGVYAEHLLWPAVAAAVEPFLADGREVLPITGKGTKWYRLHSSNPQTKFQRWWNDLIKRTQKKHDIPYLPFGSLRDTFPDVLRQRYSDDVASLSLHHGSLGEDKLLKCYANLPFGRLFQATREMEEFFKPMLIEL